VTAGFVAWLCLRDSNIAFLHNVSPSEWIVFPSSPSARSHRIVEMDAVFQRVFTLSDEPQKAQLSVRAYKHVELMINGNPLDFGVERNWKRVSVTNVLALLLAGTNTITAKVFNDNGPPALWLTLVTDRLTLRSDVEWQTSFAGSAWRNAAPASTPRLPRAGNMIAGSEETFSSFTEVWPVWAAFGIVATAILVVGRWWFNRLRPSNAGTFVGPLNQQELVVLILIGTLWTMLFCHNVRLLPYKVGFDSAAHIDYINYVQQRGSLPFPNEGEQMFQPPLFYATSAGLLSALALSAADATAAVVLRCFTTICGIAHFTLAFLGLRLLFPGRFGIQLVGLLMAAFLPMHLYLSHYVTNETLMALFVSGAVYLCLRIMKSETSSWRNFVVLGFLLGAAMLTKFTAVLVAPIITAALTWGFVAQGASATGWSKKIGLLLLVAAMVCGWHYVRIWIRMGGLVVGGWDPACELDWWQEDGYRSAPFFFSFGESLIRPLFSCTSSFADGIYATLWGDGLCGGALGPQFRPPWNYHLMCAGYLLAVLPTGLILIGAAISAVRLVREGGLERFVLLGFAFAISAALILVNLRVPYYASVKAFYGLCALVPLAFFGAIGWDALTRRRKRLQWVLGVVLLVWAMNSFASLWIRSNSAAARLCRGFSAAADGYMDAAAGEFARAVDTDASNAQARRWLAWALIQLGRSDEALREAEHATQLSPADGACRLQLASILSHLGQTQRAIVEARHALRLGPDNADAYRHLAMWLSESGQQEEAINVAREGLVVAPYDSDMRCSLGIALMRKGDLRAATNQFGYALALQPEGGTTHFNLGLALLQLGRPAAALGHLETAARLSPESPLMLTTLAWVLATHSDGALRNGEEAVRLAERAVALESRGNPRSLGSLAAAYAETGRFPDAIKVAEEAVSVASSNGDQGTMALCQELLVSFESGRAYRENARPAGGKQR
jgi:tetratricopeptide (TPR) repeat protein